MLIDTHAHLSDKKFANTKRIVLEAREAGVGRMIAPAEDIDDSVKIVELVQKYEDVFGLVGVHPEKAKDSSSIQEGIEKLSRMLDLEKIVGVGEIGLDFFWDRERTTEAAQIEWFRAQLALASQKGVPVAIHMREAEEETREILEEMEEVHLGQFHCFGGSEEMLKFVLDRGFYVSFAGNITYKSADNLRGLVKKVPLNRLLLETDSPLLAPEGLRGTVNQPKNVKIIARFIAEVLEVPETALVEQTTKNSLCLFFGI